MAEPSPLTFPLTSLRCLGETPGQTESPPITSHLAVSACVYYLSSKKKSADDVPQTLVDFRRGDRLYVQRLPESTTHEEVHNALGIVDSRERGEFPLRVQCSKRKDGRDSALYVLVAPSEETRQAWLSTLMMSLWPIPLLKQAVTRGLINPASIASGSAGDVGSTDSRVTAGAKSSRLLESSVLAAGGSLWAGATVQAIMATASITADAAARVGGGLALVGPVLQVVALAANCASLVATAEAGKEVVKVLYNRLMNAWKRLQEVADVLNAAEEVMGDWSDGGRSQREFVEDVFESVLRCWNTLVAVEDYMMERWVGRVRKAGAIDGLEALVEKVEEEVRRERLVEAVCRVDARFRASVKAIDERFASVEGDVADIQKVQEIHGQKLDSVIEQVAKVRNSERSLASAPSAREDKFFASNATVPAVPSGVIREGVPHLDRLTSSIVACASGSAPGANSQLHSGKLARASGSETFATQGEGGLGKTTACLLVANDAVVRRAFPDGVYFMQFGPSSNDASVISALARIVRVSGGRQRADDIKDMSVVEDVVGIAREWFAGRQVLLVLDNIWPRTRGDHDVREWAPTLAEIADRTSGSAFLFSTRDKGLARYASDPIAFDRLDMSNSSHAEVAQGIFEQYAGVNRVQESFGRADGETNTGPDADDPEYLKVVREILLLCDGWPIAIESAGAFAYALEWRWADILSKLRDRLPTLQGADGQSGLGAIWGASISFAQNLARSSETGRNAIFRGLNVRDMRERFGENWLFSRVAALAVFDSPRSVPVGVLAMQLGTSVSQAASFAQLCAGLGFGRALRSGEDQGSLMHVKGGIGSPVGEDEGFFSLHDLQYAYSIDLCNSGEDGALPLFTYHRELLSRLRALEAAGEVPKFPPDWSAAVRASREFGTACTEYFLRKLGRHICDCTSSEVRGRQRQFSGDDEDGYWVRNLNAFLVDYRWIRYCGEEGGRAQVLRTWSLIVDEFCKQANAKKPSIKSRMSVLPVGVQHATVATLKVLEAIPAFYFSGLEDTYEENSQCDRGLAGQLYGRLEPLGFWRLSGEDKVEAMRATNDLRTNIDRYACRPWLRPTKGTYVGDGIEDSRCSMVRSGGEGSMCSLTYLGLSNRRLLASGCDDGAIRIHDMDSDGAVLDVHSERSSTVVAVTRRSCRGSREEVLLASLSRDSKVQVWKISVSAYEEGAHVSGKAPSINKSRVAAFDAAGDGMPRDAYSFCIDLSSDGRRVAVGFRLSSRGEAAKHDENSFGFLCVWILSGSYSGDTGQYRGEHREHPQVEAVDGVTGSAWLGLRLDGHKHNVRSVCMSEDGQLLVSGSRDGTVRVWEIPTQARVASDVVKRHVVELPGGYVTCLKMSTNARTIFASTSRGDVHILCAETGEKRYLLPGVSGKTDRFIESMDLREFETPVLEGDGPDGHVLEFSSVETSRKSGPLDPVGHLFCAHRNGIIVEWNIQTKEVVRFYGMGSGDSGAPLSIATGAGESTASAEVSQHLGEIDLVSGYADDRLRMWSTASGLAPGEDIEQERGLSFQDHQLPGTRGVSCATWSMNGSHLAFGRPDGDIEVWSVTDDKHTRTLSAHKELVSCLDFSSNGKLLASVDPKGAVIWDVASGDCLHRIGDDDNGFSCILFVNDLGLQAMTGAVSGLVRLWDIKSGTCVRSFEGLHANKVQALGASWIVEKDPMPRPPRKSFISRLRRRTDRGKESMHGHTGANTIIFSRDSSGLRRAWSLESGEDLGEVRRPFGEGTGVLLSVEFRDLLNRLNSTRGPVTSREVRSFESKGDFKLLESGRIGKEQLFVGEAWKWDRVAVIREKTGFRCDSFKLFYSFDGPDQGCRSGIRVGYSGLILTDSIVCRALRKADGTVSTTVACVLDNLRVVFSEVVF